MQPGIFISIQLLSCVTINATKIPIYHKKKSSKLQYENDIINDCIALSISIYDHSPPFLVASILHKGHFNHLSLCFKKRLISVSHELMAEHIS